MQIERPHETRLVIRDLPARFSRPVGLGLAAMVLLVLLAGQSIWAGLGALLVAGGIWQGLRYTEVETEALFDLAADRYQVSRRRRGTEIFRQEGRLADVEGVIVEAAARSRKVERQLELRPALVVGGRPLPLSFAGFASGAAPRETALALRRFLGLPETDLIEDSLRVAARDPHRINPAIRLARLGEGLSRREAAARVRRLKAELGERSGD